MPQYFTPGVYVEEVPSAIKPIAGVGTSTAGFIGAVADDVQMPLIPGRTGLKADGKTVEPADHHTVAPAGVPQLVDGWERFKTLFGDGVKPGNRTLAQAVYGFFNNGGGRCWVTRLAPGSGEGKQGAKGVADLLPADEKVIEALEAFAVIDEIALVAVPGATSDAVQYGAPRPLRERVPA